MKVKCDPILRWAGSKRKLLPELISSVPEKYSRYIEPFAGSACLFFALNPEVAVLSDKNPDLLQMYRVLRRTPRLLTTAVHKLDDSNRTYYSLREKDVGDLTSLDRAARFLYLNRFCFNGVYRTNRLGHFNVPRGIKTGTMPGEELFFRCARALRHADLRVGDFEDILVDVGRGDFVYLDPPYASSTRRPYGEYGYDGCFGEADNPRLVNRLHRIDKAGAYFLLSYADMGSFVRQLDRRWHVRRVAVRRHVAGFAKHRRSVSEILVSNFSLADGGSQSKC
jgi:DNA adenine methylase